VLSERVGQESARETQLRPHEQGGLQVGQAVAGKGHRLRGMESVPDYG
jgi:hypothetical protein